MESKLKPVLNSGFKMATFLISQPTVIFIFYFGKYSDPIQKPDRPMHFVKNDPKLIGLSL